MPDYTGVGITLIKTINPESTYVGRILQNNEEVVLEPAIDLNKYEQSIGEGENHTLHIRGIEDLLGNTKTPGWTKNIRIPKVSVNSLSPVTVFSTLEISK